LAGANEVVLYIYLTMYYKEFRALG
jgi:hypothetical protein